MQKHIIKFIAVILLIGSITACNVSNSKSLEGYDIKFEYKENFKEQEVAEQSWGGKTHGYTHAASGEYIDEPKTHIALYDVNNDKEKEIITMDNSSCDHMGCHVRILVKNRMGNYDVIYFPGVFGELQKETPFKGSMRILKSSTNNYHDIADILENECIRIWKWNGKNYDAKSCDL